MEQQQPCRYWKAREWGRNNLKPSKTILNFVVVGETWVQGWTLSFELQLLLKKRCSCVGHISLQVSDERLSFFACLCLFSVLPLHRSGQKIQNLVFYHFLTHLLRDRSHQCCGSNTDVKEKKSWLFFTKEKRCGRNVQRKVASLLYLNRLFFHIVFLTNSILC